MQVQLKQSEIVNAIKGYLTSQGINLQGKSVDIAFTAGRKESGLTADVVIEDAVKPIPVQPVIEVAQEPEPVVESPVAAEEPAPEEAPKTPTTSLFNS